jgi:hypothetical protein
LPVLRPTGGSGIVAALAAAAIAAIILLAVAQLALAFAKSDLTRAAIGIAFAAPAAVAGYHAVHGIARRPCRQAHGNSSYRCSAPQS